MYEDSSNDDDLSFNTLKSFNVSVLLSQDSDDTFSGDVSLLQYQDSDDDDLSYYTCEEDDTYFDCLSYIPIYKLTVEEFDIDLKVSDTLKEISSQISCQLNHGKQCDEIKQTDLLSDLQSTISSSSIASVSLSESTFSGSTINNASDEQLSAWTVEMNEDSNLNSSEFMKKQLSKQSIDSQLKSESAHDISLSNEVSVCKILDLKRWHCMSRPQYNKSCGISSLMSVWNYLYSTLGNGDLPVLTQEKAMLILGFKPPFGEIRFGPFTGNVTLMKWFQRLNGCFHVKGRASYMYKPKGRFKTTLITDDIALNRLKSGLKGDKVGFIYHCLNHYFCPIGYEDTPQNPVNAYQSGSDPSATCQCVPGECDCPEPPETWVFIGEPSKKHPPMHCRRWSEILKDLHMESPNYYNIRKPEKGVITRKTKKKGANLHCIISFQKQ